MAITMANAAYAESPDHFIKRLLLDPGATLFGSHPVRHSPPPAAPDTPLIDVPMPHLRPLVTATLPTLAYQEPTPAVAAMDAATPLPRLSPADLASVATAPASPSPELRLASLPPRATVPPPPVTMPPPVAQSSCGAALAEFGAVAKALPAIDAQQCSVPDPVSISALDDGKVMIAAKPVIDCAIAETLATWIDQTVQPLATSMLGGKVTALRVLDGYACRNRDGLADAKLSEHAHANAVDIGAFEVEGHGWLTVGDATAPDAEAAFLAAVRKSACGPFTTVLGPGSDSYHATHFHLDLAQRRTAGPSHGLFCQ
ncbi:MAG TPA: extensin family protein [Bauldia sp.]